MARSKPLPRALRYISQEINRGQLLRRDKDDVKNITATIKDFDSAIMYYFSEVIKPEVQEQGEMVKVPIFYGNPELNLLYKTTNFNNLAWIAARWLELLPISIEKKQQLAFETNFDNLLNFLHTVINNEFA